MNINMLRLYPRGRAGRLTFSRSHILTGIARVRGRYAGAVLLLLAAAIGHAQTLFVSSSQDYIFEVTPGGTVSTFVNSITSPSQMAVNSSGDLFVATDGTIVQITPEGVESPFATGIYDVGGMAFNMDGDLFVSDFGTGTITEITPAGAESTFASGLDDPRGLAFDGQQILYAGTATNITAFGLSGTGRNFATVSGGVGSLAFNANFDLFAGSGTNLLEFTPNGVESTFASLAPLSGNQAMAFNSAGNLFVAATGPYLADDGVLEFAPDGTASTFASIFGNADGLAFAVPEPSALGLLALALAVGTVGTLWRHLFAKP